MPAGAPGHEKKTVARPRMHPSMPRFPAIMTLVLSLYKNRPYSVCPTTHSVDRVRDGSGSAASRWAVETRERKTEEGRGWKRSGTSRSRAAKKWGA